MSTAAVENSLAAPLKVKQNYSAILLVGVSSKEWKAATGTDTRTHTFTVTKGWRQPECPSI